MMVSSQILILVNMHDYLPVPNENNHNVLL
jgi:hypothetical protein